MGGVFQSSSKQKTTAIKRGFFLSVLSHKMGYQVMYNR